MRSVLSVAVLLLCISVSSLIQNGHSASFWDAEFVKKPFDIFQFAGSYITIFQHASQHTVFYVPPPVMLDKNSGSVMYNSLKRLYECRWDVILWTEDIAEAVKEHLRSQKKIPNPSIRIIPMDQIRFVFASVFVDDIDERYTLENAWRPNNHLPFKVSLVFYTRGRDDANSLLSIVKSNALVFDQINMEYHLTSQKTATKSILIKASYIAKAKLFSKLETMSSPDISTRMLSAKDLNQLAQESYMKIKATVVRETEYIEAPDETKVVNLIEKLLVKEKIEAEHLTEQAWRSAFWDPIYARPDKIASMLNKVYEKEASSSKYLTVKENAKSAVNEADKESTECVVFQCKGESSSSKNKVNLSDKMTVEKINNKLKEKNIHVEFNGEIFLPKNLDLYKVNIAEIKSGKDIATTSIQISRKAETFAIKLKTQSDVNSGSEMTDYSRLVCSDNLYFYKGCYQDSPNERDLNQAVIRGDRGMSIQMCYDACADRKAKFFGLQKGTDCYCGFEFGKYGLRYEQKCDSRCAGSPKDVCGGKNLNSIYEIQKFPTAGKNNEVINAIVVTPDKEIDVELTGIIKNTDRYAYKGCYYDDRLSSWSSHEIYHEISSVMSAEICYKVCTAERYDAFGLQMAQTKTFSCLCWDANRGSNGLFGGMRKASDRYCEHQCSGANRQEFCGGNQHTMVYSILKHSASVNTGRSNNHLKLEKFSKLGCFKSVEAWKKGSDFKTWGNSVTPKYCYDFCNKRDKRYFDLQDGFYCFCLDNKGNNNQISSECTTACITDSSITCGGTYAVNRYVIN